MKKYLTKIIFYIVKFMNYRKLAQQAESNMEAIEAPLFLRFINLLINDAVFLLDDALTNISQLREIMNDRYPLFIYIFIYKFIN